MKHFNMRTALLLVAIVVNICFVVTENSLQLLHVIFRHGFRTPADTYPTDPYINETFFPVGWGYLTKEGKLQMYKNGQFIRERYNDFLGDFYGPKVVYARATDSDRTITSTQLMLAGIWPPNEAQNWGPLKWQPIPVRSDVLNDDNLLLVRKPCAQYHLELEKVMSEEEVAKKLKLNQKLFKRLNNVTGLSIKDFDDVQSLYSTLRAEEAYKLILPKWTVGFYPHILEPLTEYSYVVNAYNDKLKRLKGGVLLRKLLVDWFQASNQSSVNSSLANLLRSKKWVDEASVYGSVTNDRKLFLFGGHDATITNLLMALNVWDTQIPDYGITAIFELQKTPSNQFGIQIFLRNQTDAAPHLLSIPNCGNFCPLEKLVELVDPLIPRDLAHECKTDDPNYVPPELGGP